MADIDSQLVDVVWLDDCHFSFQLVSTGSQALWLTLEQVKQGPYILKYKAHISTQADDDDNIVSSLTLKLRYSNNTQHTAFFFFFF